MEDFVLELLKDSGADGWMVTDELRRGWEFYFIRRALDQNRVREVEHLGLTVYKKFSEDGKDFLGSASAQLPPMASRAEAQKLIAALLDEAKLIRNPAYTLNPPCGEPTSTRMRSSPTASRAASSAPRASTGRPCSPPR